MKKSDVNGELPDHVTLQAKKTNPTLASERMGAGLPTFSNPGADNDNVVHADDCKDKGSLSCKKLGIERGVPTCDALGVSNDAVIQEGNLRESTGSRWNGSNALSDKLKIKTLHAAGIKPKHAIECSETGTANCEYSGIRDAKLMQA